ncbi:hypothetical protein VitviT2T_028972 [Vitis vinifera]|uniref:Beta-amyrin 28-monooxygenase n=2 Tax=Vitis vinifera TaxID=29760 RepID=F6I461_VITVI|nr:beta-amyrin 6-beta-monooxygenase [Vitis vinifera]WKA11477.1 hypothetical protein VitviT2T_028972 [Vitis vinifera]|eukprot:XP_002278948.1 PREDICTED: beta-amyrin 28-oxidase [Vitis vinifera]
MDLFSAYLPYLVAFCLSLPLIIFVFLYKPSNTKLPPGKMGLPIIGESIEYGLAAARGNPQGFIADRMTQYSPDVFRTSLMGENMAVMCGAAGNKFLFSNENKLVKSWWPRSVYKVLYFPSPNDKDSSGAADLMMNMKSYLIEFVKPDALQQYIPVMDSMAREHIDMDWAPNREVKVFQLVQKYTFALACRLFMYIQGEENIAKIAHPFHLIVQGFMSVPIDLPGTGFNRGIKGGKMIREEIEAVIKRRRTELLEKGVSKVPDLLSRMLLSPDEKGRHLNDIEINSYMVGLLLASHDTTSSAITFTLKYLALFPDVHNKVLKEQMEIAQSKGPGELLNWSDIQKMKYTWCVARESMRLAPPAQGAFREATTDFTFAGFTIPKGWKTHWCVHSTHKNPKYFPNPEKFDPSRFEGKGPEPYTFVPFGGGPRMCVGKEYARLEILVFIHNVVTKFKLETVLENEKILFGLSALPAKGLPIRLQPHQN